MILIILGVVAGLIFGSIVAYLNCQISKSYLKKKNNGGGKSEVTSVMGVNIARLFIDTIAIASVFFLRNLIPLPFESVAIGTALGISVVSPLLIMHLSKQQN